MFKKITLAASVATMALYAIPQARAEDTIAVIVKATTSEYWQTVFKGAEAAGKQLGIKIEELGTPKDDAAGQIAVLEGAAGKKPLAIVISPTIFEALGDPVAAVTKAGIPVIIIDSGAKTDKFASFLTTDNVAGGKAAKGTVVDVVSEAARHILPAARTADDRDPEVFGPSEDAPKRKKNRERPSSH